MLLKSKTDTHVQWVIKTTCKESLESTFTLQGLEKLSLLSIIGVA